MLQQHLVMAALGNASVATDPNFANVSALLHFEGSNASTTFTDQTGKTWTAHGNAQIDTSQFKFGAASGLFDGTGDWISAANDAGFDFGSGDFTIEGFVRLNTVSLNHNIIGKYAGAATGPFAIYQTASQIGLYIASVNTSWNMINNQTFGTGLSTATWYHLAATRSGNVFRTFRDGALIATSGTVSGTLVSNTGTLTLGANDSGVESFNGWLDEWRITKGVARYTAAFTAPTSPFPDA